jgi:hypothetical protein
MCGGEKVVPYPRRCVGGGGGGDPSHTLEDVRSREAGGDPPLPYKVSGGGGVVVTPRTLEDVRGGW